MIFFEVNKKLTLFLINAGILNYFMLNTLT